jgi:hypothetical protein
MDGLAVEMETRPSKMTVKQIGEKFLAAYPVCAR